MIAKYSIICAPFSGIFLDWQKFNGTPAFAQRVLFAAERGVDQPKNTKRRSHIWLLLAMRFSCTSRAAVNAARALSSSLVIRRDQTLRSTSGWQSDRIGAKRVVSQCAAEQLSAAGRVPLGQRAEHPGVGDTFDRFRILRSDFFDCLAQRPRIRFRVRSNQRAHYPGIDIIWFNCQARDQEPPASSAIASQIQITQRDLLKREKVARIQLDSAL